MIPPLAQPAVRHAPKGPGGDGLPPLVLLHGFIGGPSAWQAVLDAMPAHGAVVCPWLPGHGPAPAQPGAWDETVAQLAAAFPPGAIVAGYSLGARLALAAALAAEAARGADLRAAVLIGGHVGLQLTADRAARTVEDDARAVALRTRPLDEFVANWETLPLFATQQALPGALRARQRELRLAHDAPALAWAFEVAGLSRMPDLRGALADSKQRFVLLTGALDTRYTALAASLARPPGVTHRSVDGAGHNLLLEAPADVAASLADLMDIPPKSDR